MLPKVLIVEDDEIIQRSMRRVLASEEYAVEVAEGFAAACCLLQQEAYAVVVTDLFLADGSGLEMLSWIKKHSPSTEVIIISGYFPAEVLQEAEGVGVLACLTKPVKPVQLKGKIREGIARALKNMSDKQ